MKLIVNWDDHRHSALFLMKFFMKISYTKKLPSYFIRNYENYCCGVSILTELSQWILGVAASAGTLGFIAYMMRSTLGRFFTKSVEYQFDKKFEKFKAGIRSNEKELEQIRSFLVLARRERDSTLQFKRFEAAEALMRLRQALYELKMLVEYLSFLNIDEVMKNGDDPKITAFINALIIPINIDGKLKAYSEIDKTLPELYLSECSKKTFEIYKGIILNAVATMKILSIPLRNKPDLIKRDSLVKKIIEAVPSSKGGFEKYGDSYAFYWLDYFYSETLNELRNELLGAANMTSDTEAATRLVVDSFRAQTELRSSLQQYGLSEALLKSDANVEVG